MKRLVSVILLISITPACQSQPLNTAKETASRSAVVRELKSEIVNGHTVNEGSALKRSFITLNDPQCPLSLQKAGIEANGRYYTPVGLAAPGEPITAFQVRYVLYDVFGSPIRILQATHIRDIPLITKSLVDRIPLSDIRIQLSEMGSWESLENEAKEMLTVVAFVAQVRTTEGKIWRFDEPSVMQELGRLNLKISSGSLESVREV